MSKTILLALVRGDRHQRMLDVRNTALSEIALRRSLQKAWRFIFERTRPLSRNTRGSDGVSINDFAREEKPYLRRLGWELTHGAFEFLPLRPLLIPKTDGRDRLICVPTVRDRIVQRALLDFLTVKYLKTLSNPISYGFVKYRTVQDAANLACQQRSSLPWVFKTDITSFFDQIDRAILATAIRRIIRHSSVYPLLIAAIACEIDTPGTSAAKRIKALGIRKGEGARQGMPLSPFFANIMLYRFDRTVIETDYHAIRYADDIVFFATGEQQCYEIHKFCRHELAKINLSIPDIGSESKSKIYAPNESAEFLGLGLCPYQGRYILRLMPKQIEKIKMEFEQLGSIRELLSRGITLASLGAHIQSRVTGYLSAYEACTNISEVESNFAGLTQKILRKVYREGLAINMEGLSAEARTFLGLS